ncbi:MAG TPA: glycogen synthase [Candidatus Polarisedimenticolia bacterium]|nr:glycogen synthase [Candidatus Polarisedimenticolia bacterium]
MRPFDIWMISAEMSPLAQTGGLADVVRALPPALQRRGHRVRVFLPAYGRIDRRPFAYVPQEDHLAVPLGWSRVPVRFLSRDLKEGVRLTLVQSEEVFGRDGLYGPPGGDYDDNDRRFTLLSRAVCELAARAAAPPDILHGHDWHASLVPLFARFAVPWRGRRPGTVQTIHNMGYQGRFGGEAIDWIAPPGPVRGAVFHEYGLEAGGDVNFLQGGLRYADKVTAVSPRYAWEITTPEGGFGLHDVAGYRGRDLVGILNGADYEHWDPSRDPHIAVPYDPATIERKEECRRALRVAFGLEAGTHPPAGAVAPAPAPAAKKSKGTPKTAAGKTGAKTSKSAAVSEAAGRAMDGPAVRPASGAPGLPDRPVLGVVSRLVDQKGIDVLVAAAPALIAAGADLIVLGSGDQRIVAGLERLRAEHPRHVGIFIGFNEPLSHQVVAGSDLLLVPSRYEPCGLVQMHAMRYGTIPIVHRTGGLADTVRDVDEHPGRGTGFVFDRIDPGSLAHATQRAMTLRASSREAWRALQDRAMAQDFSWDRAAAAYEDLFAGITSA